MANENDLTDTIVSAAGTPASASVDGQSQTARSIADLTAADRYLAGKAARSNRRRGIQFSKLIPPGAAPDCGQSPCSFDSPSGC